VQDGDDKVPEFVVNETLTPDADGEVEAVIVELLPAVTEIGLADRNNEGPCALVIFTVSLTTPLVSRNEAVS
jgi:hypothetical protein